MSTTLASVEAARNAAAAAQRSFPDRWSDLQSYFDVYSARLLTKYAQMDHNNADKPLESYFNVFVTNLDKMRDIAAFYRTFTNLSRSDERFSSIQAIEHLRPKLDCIVRNPLPNSDTELNLSAFLLSLHLPSQQRTSSAVEFNDVSHHFSAQFARPFKGKAPLRFLRFALGVQAYFDGSADRDLYFKGTPIVQSSGTGKTRMVLELANYVPLLYICLRDQASTPLHGFPQRDARPVAYFSKYLEEQVLDDKEQPQPKYCCDLQVAAFLGAWFEKLALRLADKPDAKDKHDMLLQFVRYGTRGSARATDSSRATTEANQATIDVVAETGKLRDKFFSEVCDAAATLLQTAPPPDRLYNNRPIFQFCLESRMRSLADQLRAVRDYLWKHNISKDDQEFLQQNMSKQNKQFLQGIVGENIQLDPRELPIFVAVDECVHLIRTFTNKSDDEHQLNSLRRAWNYINEQETEHAPGTPGFWLVLLSTNSAASILIEKSEARGSDRAKGMALTPTWVNTGFDLMRYDSEPLPCAGAAADLEHLKTYGRPLWVSLRPRTFWADAQLKLLNAGSYDERCKQIDGSHLDPRMQELHFAILASRLALSFCPAVKGQPDYEGIAQDKLATGSVDRHMRILKRIVDGYRLDIASPSEPVLAIAAAFVMMPLFEIRPGEVIQARVQERYRKILEKFQLGCLPLLKKQDALKGDIGELVARLLLMVAWDAAKLKRLHSAQGDRMPASVPSRAVNDGIVGSSAAASPSKELPAVAPRSIDRRFQDVYSPLRLRDWLDQVCTLSSEDQILVDERLDWVRSQLVSTINLNLDTVKEQVDIWTNFTHFDGPKYIVGEISCDYLWYCWKRGAAIQTRHNQLGIDGIIPVFVGDLNRAFASEKSSHSAFEAFHPVESAAACHMTYIGWQVKNRDKRVSTSDPMESLRGPKLMTSGPRAITEKGVLTLFMESGTESKLQHSRSPHKMTKVEKWKPPPKEGKGVEQVRSSRKRGFDLVDATTQERASAIPAKVRATSTEQASRQGPTSGSTARQDETAADPSASAAHCESEASAPGPTPCQKGFLLVKVRGVLQEDVYPGLTTLDVRDIVASMVKVHLRTEKIKPYFERDNSMVMPLDTREPHISGHIIEGDSGASKQGRASSLFSAPSTSSSTLLEHPRANPTSAAQEQREADKVTEESIEEDDHQ
ncbi:uncharacterized protein SPSC_03459 [Sporisorium scitamineum]|uniref:Uncharacterized protein n=1 Tax=Sporisorium scitamineum TaxID=49012 RepID=A0A0F7S004_9BASI|nr:uncharacterized protein SPSC_03459 [Sporisorium scitamineum]CDS00928.1 hypothetical protein [Sporisorium scitamineum]